MSSDAQALKSTLFLMEPSPFESMVARTAGLINCSLEASGVKRILFLRSVSDTSKNVYSRKHGPAFEIDGQLLPAALEMCWDNPRGLRMMPCDPPIYQTLSEYIPMQAHAPRVRLVRLHILLESDFGWTDCPKFCLTVRGVVIARLCHQDQATRLVPDDCTR